MVTVRTGFRLINGCQVIDKAPSADLDYYWSLSAWLNPGETIVDVTFEPFNGVQVDTGKSTFNDTSIVVWVTGTQEVGPFGPDSPGVTANFRTSQGREDSRTIYFKIVKR